MRTEMQSQFQYRAATYMYLLGMVAEPVIYLVVWTTIADQSGGVVGGLTGDSSPPTTSCGRWCAR